MPNSFTPPQVPPESSQTIPLVREDVRRYARTLNEEILRLNTYVNTLSGGGGGSGNLDGGHSDSVYGGTTPVDGGAA